MAMRNEKFEYVRANEIDFELESTHSSRGVSCCLRVALCSSMGVYVK
jgi:hypothetical protein